MKKFLAIVMTLAMVISMMTVVSFAANSKVTINFATVTCKAGETVQVPMSVDSDIAVKTGGVSIKNTALPTGITLSTTSGAAAAHVDGINEDVFDVSTKAHTYIKATKTHTFSFKTWEDTTINEDLSVITFTVAADVAPGSYTVNFTPTAKNAAGTVLANEVGTACTIVVEADAPAYEDGFYNLTTADNKASVTYFGTVEAATLYVATYNKVGTGLELVSVKAAPIAAATVAELTTVTTEAADAGEVVKAFLWDANMNAVTVGTLAE